MSGQTSGSLVIAHRGASGHRPENTLPAYQLAVDQGADMIEIDLHRTRDGAIVITHDEKLAGLEGDGEISGASLEQIRELDAGEGERIPTLEEVLDAFGPRIDFNLEIKRGSYQRYDGLEAATLEAVRSRGLLDRMLFSCFWDPELVWIREHCPEARIGLLVSRHHPQGAVERALELGAEALHPELPIADQGLVDQAHAEGLQVYVFTVDDPGEMGRLLDLGVDGLFTNHPDRMVELLRARSGLD